MASSIAKTPDEYLLDAIARVQAVGSRITDFHAGGVARTLLEAHAAMLSTQSLVAEQLRIDSYLATATGDALDQKAADNQVTRKAAQLASGTVRLTRQTTGTAVTLPAGFSELATVPVPGAPSVSFLTTADAVFSTTDTFKVVPAVAVVGGQAGNIGASTKLLPVNPVNGFATDGGFQAETTFQGGVDQESDDQLRTRIPIEVQGRSKGTLAAFLAAALRVPGVTSAKVLQATDARGDATTVAVNNVEVYYEGVASLLTQVQSECDNARVAGQNLTVFTAASERIVANLTVFALAGADTVQLAADVSAAVRNTVNAFGVGSTVLSAAVIQAVQQIAAVVSQTIPYADLRKFTDPSGTFSNVAMVPVKFPDLAAADVTVAVSLLT